MKRTILKGWHYCLNFLNFKPRIGKLDYVAKYSVCFNDNCEYDIDEDQSDVNKLFGVSYGWHHKQSDRIGWRYKPTAHEREDVELVLYSYENGRRYTFPICKIEIGDVVNVAMSTTIYNGYRRIYIKVGKKELTIMLKHTNQCIEWGYTLGSFFGGNRRAPHTMNIDITKLSNV